MVTLTALRYGVEVETTGQTRETVVRAIPIGGRRHGAAYRATDVLRSLVRNCAGWPRMARGGRQQFNRQPGRVAG